MNPIRVKVHWSHEIDVQQQTPEGWCEALWIDSVSVTNGSETTIKAIILIADGEVRAVSLDYMSIPDEQLDVYFA